MLEPRVVAAGCGDIGAGSGSTDGDAGEVGVAGDNDDVESVATACVAPLAVAAALVAPLAAAAAEDDAAASSLISSLFHLIS